MPGPGFGGGGFTYDDDDDRNDNHQPPVGEIDAEIGGFTYDDDNDLDDDQRRSAAAGRGALTPSLDKPGTYMGGKSREEEEQREYIIAYGDQTMPKESRQAREGRERVQAEARGLEEQDRAAHRQPPQEEQPRQMSEDMQAVRDKFRSHAVAHSNEVDQALNGPLKGMASLDGWRQSRDANSQAKPTLKDESVAFKAAGSQPKQGQTVVEALRERQANGNQQPITDRNSNQYRLQDDKLIISDRDGKDTHSMNAEKAHRAQADHFKSKGLGSDQSRGIQQ